MKQFQSRLFGGRLFAGALWAGVRRPRNVDPSPDDVRRRRLTRHTDFDDDELVQFVVAFIMSGALDG